MSQANRTDGRMDGRTDGQTLFYRTLPAEAGVQKVEFSITKSATIK